MDTSTSPGFPPRGFWKTIDRRIASRGARRHPTVIGILLFLLSVPILAQGALGSISGQKVNDLNGNGSLAGDPGLAGWTIQLDLGANGTVDATTVTGPGGSYSFTNLIDGTYRVREVGQAGWFQTTINPADIVISGGNSVTGVNFGNFQLGSISGQKFNDLNGDGIQDPGEPGLAFWTIQLDRDANGTVDATTVTNAVGTFSFTGLTAGTYRIREVNQVGWTQTSVNPGDVVISSGTVATGLNFGNLLPGTPTSTPTNTPTSTPTSTPTNTPTSTPTNTPTSTPTSTPTNTPTSTPTNTPTATPTFTAVPPTATPTPIPAVPTLSYPTLSLLALALAAAALLLIRRP